MEAVTDNLSDYFVAVTHIIWSNCPKQYFRSISITWTLWLIFNPEIAGLPVRLYCFCLYVSEGRTGGSDYRECEGLDNWSVTALQEKSKLPLELQTRSLAQPWHVQVTDKLPAWLHLSCLTHSAGGAFLFCHNLNCSLCMKFNRFSGRGIVVMVS